MAQILRVHDGDEGTNPIILLKVPGVTFAPCMYESAIYACIHGVCESLCAIELHKLARGQAQEPTSREAIWACLQAIGLRAHFLDQQLGAASPWTPEVFEYVGVQLCIKDVRKVRTLQRGWWQIQRHHGPPVLQPPSQRVHGRADCIVRCRLLLSGACVFQAAACDICNVTHTGFHFSRDSGRTFEQSLCNDHTRFQPVKTTKTCIPERRCADQAGRAACRLYCHPAYRVYITPRCS